MWWVDPFRMRSGDGCQKGRSRPWLFKPGCVPLFLCQAWLLTISCAAVYAWWNEDKWRLNTEQWNQIRHTNASVKMIQNVRTSEILHLDNTSRTFSRHPTTLQGTRKMGAVSSSGPFLPTACSLDFRKAKKEMVKTKPKPKATPLRRNCRDIWL